MTLQKLLIIAIFIGVVYNLAAALYYLYKDQGGTNRTVRSLSWRIGLSLALIALVMVGILTGWIEPHGIRPSGL